MKDENRKEQESKNGNIEPVLILNLTESKVKAEIQGTGRELISMLCSLYHRNQGVFQIFESSIEMYKENRETAERIVEKVKDAEGKDLDSTLKKIMEELASRN